MTTFELHLIWWRQKPLCHATQFRRRRRRPCREWWAMLFAHGSKWGKLVFRSFEKCHNNQNRFTRLAILLVWCRCWHKTHPDSVGSGICLRLFVVQPKVFVLFSVCSYVGRHWRVRRKLLAQRKRMAAHGRWSDTWRNDGLNMVSGDVWWRWPLCAFVSWIKIELSIASDVRRMQAHGSKHLMWQASAAVCTFGNPFGEQTAGTDNLNIILAWASVIRALGLNPSENTHRARIAFLFLLALAQSS